MPVRIRDTLTVSMPEPRPALTVTQWLICIVAAIGFAFDIYEILVLPLIVGPALADLGGLKPGTPDYANWVSLLFYVPAIAGGSEGAAPQTLQDQEISSGWGDSGLKRTIRSSPRL